MIQSDSINAQIIQKQSISNGVLSDGFSSLLHQEQNKEENSTQTSKLNIHQQILQNQAYLNKIALGIASF
ncbi:MAG: hypothetical protein IE909_07040 [Campylobacterales bacterium]|nr:hypothetical protein [Campylobacterales bacterium]